MGGLKLCYDAFETEVGVDITSPGLLGRRIMPSYGISPRGWMGAGMPAKLTHRTLLFNMELKIKFQQNGDLLSYHSIWESLASKDKNHRMIGSLA